MPPSTAQEIYGQRLRQARKSAGWTQPELGRCLDVDPATAAVRISRYENGQHMPDGPTADALAKVLRLPMAWFYAETDAIAEAILLVHRLPKGKQALAIDVLRKAASTV